MAKLTFVELETLNTLIKAGMPYDKAIALVLGITDTKPQTFNKVERTTATANKVSNNTKTSKEVPNKPVSKANTTKTDSSKAANKPTSKAGKVKVGDYFKVVVDKDGKPTTTRIGKADSIDQNDKIVWAKVGGDKKGYALEKCYPISKAEYGKLKKKLKVSEAKNPVSTSTKLTAKDYKVVYCFNLTKLGKITDEEFAKAKDSNDVATELYNKFKAEVKLANSEAIKLFAENCKASQPQA